MLSSLCRVAFVLGICGSLVEAYPLRADTLVTVDQQRSVNTFVIVPQCSGTDSDGQDASGFNPFDASVQSELICDLAFAVATADQVSLIEVGAMTASGSASSQAEAGVFDTIHAIADSFFSVTIQVQTEVEFTLQGTLSTDSTDDPLVLLAGANISLMRPGGATLFSHAVSPGPNGEPNSLVVDQAGVLPPGIYTLRAEAVTVIDNQLPPGLSAHAAYDFLFQLGGGCPVDVDLDGSVGPTDLALLLGAWGPNAGHSADLDGDGAVGAADLGLLLGNWGPC